MALEKVTAEEQIEIAHIFVNDFMARLSNSSVELDPEILSAVLMKTAGGILLETHKESLINFREAVNKNFNSVHELFFKKEGV